LFCFASYFFSLLCFASFGRIFLETKWSSALLCSALLCSALLPISFFFSKTRKDEKGQEKTSKDDKTEIKQNKATSYKMNSFQIKGVKKRIEKTKESKVN